MSALHTTFSKTRIKKRSMSQSLSLSPFFKIGVLKNLTNFTGKHLRWSLFLIKLHVNFLIKFTPFFSDCLLWLLLKHKKMRKITIKDYDHYHCTKMKFSIKDFFSKCDQIRTFLRIWSHLLNKSLMQIFIFCAV